MKSDCLFSNIHEVKNFKLLLHIHEILLTFISKNLLSKDINITIKQLKKFLLIF